jgi:hypothetical protein
MIRIGITETADADTMPLGSFAADGSSGWTGSRPRQPERPYSRLT